MDMIRQFIVEPIVDAALTRTPFKELTEHLWKTQLALTNLLGQTNDFQFWNEWKRKPENQMILESCSIGIWGRIKFV